MLQSLPPLQTPSQPIAANPTVLIHALIITKATYKYHILNIKGLPHFAAASTSAFAPALPLPKRLHVGMVARNQFVYSMNWACLSQRSLTTAPPG